MTNRSPDQQGTNTVLVSIGIPTFQRPEQLRKTLHSLVQQTYQNLEILISDNASGDGQTQQVAQQFMEQDPRIRYYRHLHNVGMYANFKCVFEQSTGDYFCWVADDDTRSPDFIEACLSVFQTAESSPRFGHLVIVNTYSALTDGAENPPIRIDKGCTTIGLSPFERYYQYLSTIYTDQAAVGDLIYGLMKRSTMEYAFSIQPNILSWDHVFLATLALVGEFYTIPKVKMTSAPSGMSTKVDPAEMARIQGIDNALYISKARWIRVFFLLKRLWTTPGIPFWGKNRMGPWLIIDTLKGHC